MKRPALVLLQLSASVGAKSEHPLAAAIVAEAVIWQNLAIAMSVIVVLMASALGFSLPLTVGVAGYEGSTVLVCLNGLRLLTFRAKIGSWPSPSPSSLRKSPSRRYLSCADRRFWVLGVLPNKMASKMRLLMMLLARLPSLARLF
jgi:hypothetical protein